MGISLEKNLADLYMHIAQWRNVMVLAAVAYLESESNRGLMATLNNRCICNRLSLFKVGARLMWLSTTVPAQSSALFSSLQQIKTKRDSQYCVQIGKLCSLFLAKKSLNFCTGKEFQSLPLQIAL